MVALLREFEFSGGDAQRFLTRHHTDRWGAARCSKSSEQVSLRHRIYDELEQSDSCSRDPIGYGGGGLGLYEFLSSSPVDGVDFSGLREQLQDGDFEFPVVSDDYEWDYQFADPTDWTKWNVIVSLRLIDTFRLGGVCKADGTIVPDIFVGTGKNKLTRAKGWDCTLKLRRRDVKTPFTVSKVESACGCHIDGETLEATFQGTIDIIINCTKGRRTIVFGHTHTDPFLRTLSIGPCCPIWSPVGKRQRTS